MKLTKIKIIFTEMNLFYVLFCFIIRYDAGESVVDLGAAPSDKHKQRVDLEPVDIHGYDGSTTHRPPLIVFEGRGPNRGHPPEIAEGRGGNHPPAGVLISGGYSRVSGTPTNTSRDGPAESVHSAPESSDRGRSIGNNIITFENEVDPNNDPSTASSWGSDRSHLEITTKRYFWNSWLMGSTQPPPVAHDRSIDGHPSHGNPSLGGASSNTVTTVVSPPALGEETDYRRIPDEELNCPQVNGLFPHPYECSKYLQCAHATLYIRDCGPGTVFNPIHSVCDWPYNVKCEDSQPGIQGRSPGTVSQDPGKTVVDGLMDRASDMASAAVENIEGTASGLLNTVNDVVREVNWGISRGVDKTKRILKKLGAEVATLCPQDDGQFPYFKDCRMYINCWHSRPHLQTCPTNLLFNGATGTCDWASRVVCPKARVVVPGGSDATTPEVLIAPPSGQRMRLRGGEVPWVGYVQIWDNSSRSGGGSPGWGLITDRPNGWTERDGDVVCKTLGYERGAASVTQGRLFGLIPGERVALHAPQCLGSEGGIEECLRLQQSSEQKEEPLASVVAGVRCIVNNPSLCESGGVLRGGKCYYLVTANPVTSLNLLPNSDFLTMDHSKAKAHCSASGKRLLTIMTEDENHFVSELLSTLPADVPGIHLAAVRTSLLGEVLWIWQGTEVAPSSSLGPYTKWWTGWNSTGSSPQTSPYITPGLEGDITSTLCVVLRELFQFDSEQQGRSLGNEVHADYHWWELGNCAAKLGVICEAPARDIGCMVGRGSSYRGKANITTSGSRCVAPPASSPLYPSPKYYQSLIESQQNTVQNNESLASLSFAALKKINFYCRNFNSEDLPWCYIDSGITEYCDIPRCSNQTEDVIAEGSSCPAGKLLCPRSRECIYSEWFCDGREDCSSGDDEEDCPDYTGEYTSPVLNSRLTNGEVEKWLYTPLSVCASRCAVAKRFNCQSFNYQQNTSTCVLCDAVAGRFGGLAKEFGWEYHERSQYSVPPELCQNKCEDGRCYSNEQICDGRRDCRSGIDEHNCMSAVDFSLRLVNGSDNHEGRVEIRVLGRWGGVCDDLWDLFDGDVVCKQLGFELGAREVHVGGKFGGVENSDDENVQMFLMDDVNCGGNEERLQDCSFAGWGEHDCNKGESAGVTCALEGDACTDMFKCGNGRCIDHIYLCDGMDDCYDESDEKDEFCKPGIELRLMGNREDSGELRTASNGLPIEGRVEVMFRGVWGTICDDDFGLEEGHVVCRSLNLGGAAAIYKNNYFGPGSGKIWLDDMQCLGHEESLEQCSHRGWGLSNCDHSEDVGVRCEENLLLGVEMEASSVTLPPDTSPLFPTTCGIRHVVDTPISPTQAARVVGGKHTRAGAHPWMVGVRVRTSTGSGHWCGGSILSSDFVMTAAHCLSYPATTYILRIGDYDNTVEEEHEQEFYAERVLKHPDFDKGPFYNNDIALLKIKRRNRTGIIFSEHVQPLCLVQKNFNYPSGLNCTVAGWGAIAHNMAFSETLRSTSLPIIPDSVCRSDRVFGTSKLSGGMFCAGYLEGGVDTCQGDSGGPLVCYINGRYTAVGITSWGHGCARPNKPGVYTRLTNYLDWMFGVMRSTSHSFSSGPVV